MKPKIELTVDVIDPGPLTKTEAKILKFMCMGWLKPKIADFLHRSHHTIDTHEENIKQKLHAHGKTEVIAIAVADHMVKISRTVICLTLIFNFIMDVNNETRVGRNRLRELRPEFTRTRMKD